MRRFTMAVLVALSSVATAAPMIAVADTGGCIGNGCHQGPSDGINAMSQEQTQARIDHETQQGRGGTGGGPARPYSVEFRTTISCPNSQPGQPAIFCQAAVRYCQDNWPDSVGPLEAIYDRRVYTNGSPSSPWTFVGNTCYTDLVPAKPALTLAMIRDAFHHTPFAKPGLRLQPKGNLTLVTLPAYFEVRWPAAGYQPGEVDPIDPARMLGNHVRIRPTLISYRYRFGDGSGAGPTTSPGGTYPGGDITHAYDDAGRYATRVDITYGGEFSVNGSGWIPLTDTETINGTAQTLTVTTAINRLYDH